MRPPASARAKPFSGSFPRASTAAGRCATKADSSRASSTLTQQFQRVGGTLTLRGKTQPVLGAYVDGDVLGFTFVDLDGGVRSVRARIDGGTLSGSLRFAGTLTPVTGAAAMIGSPPVSHYSSPRDPRLPMPPDSTVAPRRPPRARGGRTRARRTRARARATRRTTPRAPVKVIVPFSPGGAVDGPMRMIAQELGKRLGQQFVVENKPGAGATIGTELVARAAPDGYTLLLASQTNAISATLYTKLAYDPIEDFAPISLIGREPGVLVVNPALPVKTFQEFVAYVKERPGQIDYASSGNGSGQHLFAALLASATGLKMNHIPYKGSGQATTDLLGGQVMVSIPGTAGMVGHIKAGKLRALAVTGATRSPQLPDVPTLIESGVPGFEAYVWMGLLAPKGTPRADRRPAPPRGRRGARDPRGQDVHGDRGHRDRRLDARRIRTLLPVGARPVGEGRARHGREDRLSRPRKWRDAPPASQSGESHDCARNRDDRRHDPRHRHRALDREGNAGR